MSQNKKLDQKKTTDKQEKSSQTTTIKKNACSYWLWKTFDLGRCDVFELLSF